MDRYGYLGLAGLAPHRSAQAHQGPVGGGIQIWHADPCQMLKDSYYGRPKDCSGSVSAQNQLSEIKKNMERTDFWFGVDDLGLHIHEEDDKLTPKISFPWSEVGSISFNNKEECP